MSSSRLTRPGSSRRPRRSSSASPPLGGGGVVEAHANATGTIEAYIGANTANAASGAATDIDVGSGNVHVIVEPLLVKARAEADAAGLSGGISINLVSPEASITARASAYIRNGVDIDAGNVIVRAGNDGALQRVVFDASFQSFVGSAAGLASGSFVTGFATTAGTVEAFIGAPAGTLPAATPGNTVDAGSSTVVVRAYSQLIATAIADGGGFSGGFTISLMRPTAEVSGQTRAYIGSAVTVSAGGLDIDANGDYDANANTISVAIGGLAAINGARAIAKVTGVVDAHVGAAAGSVPSAVVGDVNLGSGLLDLDAYATMDAVPTIASGSVAAIAVTMLKLVGEVTGTIRAYIGEGVDVDAGSVDIDADGHLKANVVSNSLNFSGLAGGSGVTRRGHRERDGRGVHRGAGAVGGGRCHDGCRRQRRKRRRRRGRVDGSDRDDDSRRCRAGSRYRGDRRDRRPSQEPPARTSATA